MKKAIILFGIVLISIVMLHAQKSNDKIFIQITDTIIPTFPQFGPYCHGETPDALPGTSDNGIVGTWLPAVINTSVPNITTYTFTPTEVECVVSYEVNILVLPSPDVPQFNIPDCMFTDQQFNFQDLINTYPELFDYEWTMGTEDILQGQQIAYSFENHGYHCIKLEVSNQCGTTSFSSGPVFVFPDECVCVHPYDQVQDLIIDEDVSWTNGSKSIDGDIIIKPEAQLIIDNFDVKFSPKSRIIVEREAKLFFANNVNLKNLGANCPYMWQGIEVWGKHDEQSDHPDQGILSVYANGNLVKIEDAHIGILLGKRNMNYFCDLDQVPYPAPFDLNYTGGIVQIENIHFVDNGTGIKYLSKTAPYDAQENKLNNCKFVCENVLLDEQYDFEHPASYPTTQNPWAAPANKFQRTDAGIEISNQKGLDIRNCEFNNLQHGILSFDSKYNVSDSKFEMAMYGIRINNTNSGVDFNHSIARCEFFNIPGYIPPQPHPPSKFHTAAIYIIGGKFDYIHDNKFGIIPPVPPYIQELNKFGISTTRTSGFRIIENVFNLVQNGITINNSGDYGGFIGAGETLSSYWKGNHFNLSARSISTSSHNPKLRIRCNVSANDENLRDLFDVNFRTQGILADQGAPTYTYTAQHIKPLRPAGNEFYPDDNDDFKTLWSDYPYTYYRHDGPPKVIPVVSPDSPAEININSTNAVAKPEDNYEACLALFFSLPPLPPIFKVGDPGIMNPPFNGLDSLKQIIDSLYSQLDDINGILDNGKTLELLDDIYGSTSPVLLKNKLISNSPLSDTVIHALLTEYPLTDEQFESVMIYNLPVRRELRSLLYTVLEQIANRVIADQLLILQANYPGSNAPGKLEKEIDLLTTDRQLLLNSLIQMLTDTVHNRREDAILLLENENNVSAEKTLISTYIADGNYTMAALKLAALPTDDPDIEDFVNLHQMMLSHYEQGYKLYDLDSTQIDFITNLAYKCPVNLAAANAQSILYFLFREEFPECPTDMGTKMMLIAAGNIFDEEEPKYEDKIMLGDNYPDPVSDITYIPYYLPAEINAYIAVYDMYGRIISKTNVCCGANIIKVNTETWKPGVYLYSLIVNNTPKITKRMVINE